MIRAVFLAHSGFLVELPSATLLFDWWKGELPAIRPEVPLLVFASHHHPDHFNRKIFRLAEAGREIRYLLGKDIKPTARQKERWGLDEAAAARCVFLGGGQRLEAIPGVTVETLPSTDEGAAFLVSADGLAVFHAGDLNWWHWEGEDKAWNTNMAANFRRYTEPLRGRRIDLAMLPLDPRLGPAGFWGPKAFLELADIRRCLPMHQWEDFGFTDRFLAEYPTFAGQVQKVTENGEVFVFNGETGPE